MSSIIVLDSSDEDEAPTKRAARTIPATMTPIKTAIPAALSTPSSLLKPPPKPRAIPSGITVTRRSPVLGDSPVLSQALANMSKQPAAAQPAALPISNALLEQALSNIAKPQLPSLPKINAAFSLNNVTGIGVGERRQTPTPPKSQLPQLQPSPHMRKRKTPTPPSSSQRNSTHTPPAATSSSPGVGGGGMLPMICAVQSLTAGATPPQQLMATPPHSAAAAVSAYNELQLQHQQLMINPHLIHTHLPASTTITAQPVLSNHHSGASYNNYNNNNSFKIHLPPKPRTPATATATAGAAVNSPSPVASPVLRTPPLISPPTSNKTTTNFTSHQINRPPTQLPEKPLRRIKPTTLLKHSDEAWQQQQRQRTLIAFNDDVSMEVLPSTSSPTPKSNAVEYQQDVSVRLSPKSKTPPTSSAQTVQALKAFRHTSALGAAVLDLTSSETSSSPKTNRAPARASAVFDLTGSPEKLTTNAAASSSKLNGDATTSSLAVEPIIICSSQETNKDDSFASSQTTSTTATTTATTTTSGEAEDCGDVSAPPPAPFEPDYAELIKVCREADASNDMEKLIKTKLIKYYYGVHPDFVRSRGFRKNVRAVVERIRAEPDLVYYNLKTIVDELKVRRKCKEVVVNNEEASGSTGNKRTDEQIKKLNKALYILTKRIESLEQAEVDWDEEDSSYLQVERFKKRACQIYEKICDLTGESKNAHRLVKKPIHFNATTLPQFNKTLQAYINRTKEFPDYFDVLHMLEHCNRQYAMGLVNFEMKRIAHDAFIKVGKLLQSRRKTDLYETVTHFTANAKDPAATDPMLLAKLSENQKNQTKISEIIEKYAREQDLTAEEQKEARLQEKLKSSNEATPKEENGKEGVADEVDNDNVNDDDDDDDDDDDEDDDEEEEEEEEEEAANDLEEDVEKLANGDLSDAESDTEMYSKDPFTKSSATKSAKEMEIEKKTIVTAAAAVAADKPPDKVVNNNLARAKTVGGGDTTSSSSVSFVQEHHKQMPNGRVNAAADEQNPSTSHSNAMPSLKISSVSSLCENKFGGNSKSDSSRKVATPTPPNTICAQSHSAKPQRTVAEIVISDEEDDSGMEATAQS